MFVYDVHGYYSVEHYKKACKYIEALFENESIVKEKELIDVDSSRLQIYRTPKGTVKIINADDFEDGVSVYSDFEISNPEWKRIK